MYLGIEIGGTKLQAGIGGNDGNLLALERDMVDPSEGHSGICRQLVRLTDRTLQTAGIRRNDLVATGIGFGGPVDSARGTIIRSHQIDGWEDFPIVAWARRELKLEARLGNDSDLAGLAEAVHGGGRGRSPVVYMNIGSGIGGALVVDGRLYEGHGLGAMELGHVRLAFGDSDLPPTLESLASGWSLMEAARRAADADRASCLWSLAGGDRTRIDTRVLVQAVEAGDDSALRVWKTAITRIALVMANAITMLAPRVFVLGGGVSLVGETLFNPLRQEVRRLAFAPFASAFEIVPAALGEAVVVHGAIAWGASGGARL